MRAIFVFLCFTATLEPSAGLAAPADRQAFEFGGGLGATVFDADFVERLGPLITFQFGYHFTRRFELEGSLGCNNGIEKTPPNDNDFTNCSFAISGLLNFRGDSNRSPYLRVGAGQAQLDRGAKIGVYDINDRSLVRIAAIGNRFYVGDAKRFAVRVDVSRMRADLFGGSFEYTGCAIGVSYR